MDDIEEIHFGVTDQFARLLLFLNLPEHSVELNHQLFNMRTGVHLSLVEC